ncbi:MAG TPA: TlpA disulfide reductase family protein [Gammaproteobacteria bacterium]|nr:TlpA disulfide reductase family protein [Gammaproteobacteria bacterium]
MRRLWLALLVSLVLVPMAGYGAGQSLTAMHPRPRAPGFALKDMNGKVHHLSDYRGQVVLVNFWATWCPPCRREMPSMERAWKKLKKQDVTILAVNVGEDVDTIFPFTGNYPVTFPILLDQSSKVVKRWPVLGLPTTFVVDPRGRIAYRAVGGRKWDAPALLKTIRSLIPPDKKPAAPTRTGAGR